MDPEYSLFLGRILEELDSKYSRLSYQELCQSLCARFDLAHLAKLRGLLFCMACLDPSFPAPLFRARLRRSGDHQHSRKLTVAADIVAMFNLMQTNGGTAREKLPPPPSSSSSSSSAHPKVHKNQSLESCGSDGDAYRYSGRDRAPPPARAAPPCPNPDCSGGGLSSPTPDLSAVPRARWDLKWQAASLDKLAQHLPPPPRLPPPAPCRLPASPLSSTGSPAPPTRSPRRQSPLPRTPACRRGTSSRRTSTTCPRSPPDEEEGVLRQSHVARLLQPQLRASLQQPVRRTGRPALQTRESGRPAGQHLLRPHGPCQTRLAKQEPESERGEEEEEEEEEEGGGARFERSFLRRPGGGWWRRHLGGSLDEEHRYHPAKDPLAISPQGPGTREGGADGREGGVKRFRDESTGCCAESVGTQTDPDLRRLLVGLGRHGERPLLPRSEDDDDDISAIFRFLDDVSVCGSTGAVPSSCCDSLGSLGRSEEEGGESSPYRQRGRRGGGEGRQPAGAPVPLSGEHGR
ncbi:hypothetical protein AAFF_G00067520 [Aldrovandia affinis]|uniref:MINAR1 N-terminal helical domain-containing protein n=1 Tax=Aldrovandia affinis TaxID=143900 RepID=A0AAD7RZ91_9TELE|nr:hypothetical protein AAFF_G00067520 [Aldrovandia affinis]